MNPYLQSARDLIDETVGRLSVETLQRKVDGRWSIGEILEHLTLVFTGSAATLEKALASGELRARRPTVKQTLGRILVVDLGYFPRVEAPSTSRPTGTIPADQALAAIRASLESLDGTLARVADKFGVSVPVSNHPYFAGLSVQQWQKFHWRHTGHHMKQARERSHA